MLGTGSPQWHSLTLRDLQDEKALEKAVLRRVSGKNKNMQTISGHFDPNKPFRADPDRHNV